MTAPTAAIRTAACRRPKRRPSAPPEEERDDARRHGADRKRSGVREERSGERGREACDSSAMLEPHRGGSHQRERTHRQRLRERIGQVADRDDLEAKRNQVVHRDGERACQAVTAHTNRHPVQKKARQRIRRTHDGSQHRHVGDAAPHEAGERHREHVETWRVRELIVAGRDRREVVAPGRARLENDAPGTARRQSACLDGGGRAVRGGTRRR